MARHVTVTYVITVPDGDDDDCIHDAEDILFQALEKGHDFPIENVERSVKVEPPSRPTVECKP